MLTLAQQALKHLRTWDPVMEARVSLAGFDKTKPFFLGFKSRVESPVWALPVFIIASQRKFSGLKEQYGDVASPPNLVWLCRC